MGNLVVVGMTVITGFLWLLTKTGYFAIGADPLRALSQILALVGATLLAINFILAARLKVVEDLFKGLDKVYHAHHWTGALATVFLINHPIWLVINAIPQYQLAKLYLLPSDSKAYTLGILALYSMLLLILITLYAKIKYDTWLKTHKLMGFPLLLASLHMLLITSDISRSPALRLWLFALTGCALAAYFYKAFLYKSYGPQGLYRVANVQSQGPYTLLKLRPVGERMKFRAGQFAFLSTGNQTIGTEPHPYSFASNPGDNIVQFAIKNLGDYTKNMRKSQAGDEITLQGPYGRFGDAFLNSDRNAIWIGGGVGITPFLSLMHKIKPKQQVEWFYSVNKPEEALFEKIIQEALQDKPNLRYRLHVAQKDGYLTAHKIREKLGGTIDVAAMIMLCGPPAMMAAMKAQLLEIGIAPSNIIYEDFSLR